MEADFIRWLSERLPPHPALRLGIGDDAAVLDLGREQQCVVTVDTLTDGVDFEVARLADRRQIGHKALSVNLSDLAAMASRPLAAVVSLVLPQQGGRELAEQIYLGLLPLAERYNVAIAGGDTNSWDGPLAISITAIGTLTPRGPLTRRGAQPGDAILVTGSFGGSILGRHLAVEPRVEESLLLHEQYELHAGIDVSDGLSLDLARLAEASRCGAIVEAAAVPIADAAQRLAEQERTAPRRDDATAPRSPLEHALGDGEDFELILAVSPAEAKRLLQAQPLPIPLTQIGHFTTDPGLQLIDSNGNAHPLVPQGFLHKI